MRQQDRKGIAMIWVVAICAVLVAVLGWMIDLSYVYLTAQQLQTTADAASLAAAGWVEEDQNAARQSAVAIAGANRAAGAAVLLSPNDSNADDGDVVIGKFDRVTGIFIPTGSNPNAVLVNARRTHSSLGGPLQLIFGPIFGVQNAAVSRSAIAMVGEVKPGIIILDHTSSGAMTLLGTSDVNISMGAIIVNSRSPSAVDANGNSFIHCDSMFMVSDQQISSENLSGSLHRLSKPVEDPLASMPEPDITGMPVRNYPKGTTNIEPGYYPKGFPKGDMSLSPGVYAIDGDVTENLIGYSVTLYLINGRLKWDGNNAVTLTPPTSGPYAGVSIFQSRDNQSSSSFYGNAQTHVEGVVYMPSGHLEIRGTADEFSNQLIVNTLTIRGEATLNINFKGLPVRLGDPFLIK